MTRRNTYVCSDRNNTDRLSVIPNGKENRWERKFVVQRSVFRGITLCRCETCGRTSWNPELSVVDVNTQMTVGHVSPPQICLLPVSFIFLLSLRFSSPLLINLFLVSACVFVVLGWGGCFFSVVA